VGGRGGDGGNLKGVGEEPRLIFILGEGKKGRFCSAGQNTEWGSESKRGDKTKGGEGEGGPGRIRKERENTLWWKRSTPRVCGGGGKKTVLKNSQQGWLNKGGRENGRKTTVPSKKPKGQKRRPRGKKPLKL